MLKNLLFKHWRFLESLTCSCYLKEQFLVKEIKLKKRDEKQKTKLRKSKLVMLSWQLTEIHKFQLKY